MTLAFSSYPRCASINSVSSRVAANAGSVFDLVTEVRLDQGKTILVFEDGADLLAEEADAVRNSQP